MLTIIETSQFMAYASKVWTDVERIQLSTGLRLIRNRVMLFLVLADVARCVGLVQGWASGAVRGYLF